MKTSDFEAKIQKEIDPDLSIRINPNAPDIAGVYWREAYIGVAVHPSEIKDEFDPKYVDNMSLPYRAAPQAFDLIKAKLPTYQNEDNYKLMTEKHE